ncbi:MAG: DUF1684 domain-containing protein, partial [Bryobacteraceae bacterium]
VAGLFWLQQGDNTAGSGTGNSIVLPAGSCPARIGTFRFDGGKTIFVAERGVAVTSDGKHVTTIEMKPDTSGSPQIISFGNLSMSVIERGKRFGVRLRDKNSEFRRKFTGLNWYPVNEAYRVVARFVPYNPPRRVSIPNVLGDTEEHTSPGYAVFKLKGKRCRLEPISEGGRLWFIFRDLTSVKETYQAGRFLYADPPKDGKVVLNFNQAYNPPCSFTPYATCPLPPRQNRLKVRIPAGEKRYHH